MVSKKNIQPPKNVMTFIIIMIFPILFSMCLTSSHDDISDFGITLKLKNEDGGEATTFNEDDLITFELTIQNLTNSTQTINFSSSYQYDFTIYNTNGESVVWVWSADKVFAQVLTGLTIEANESKIFSETWNQEIKEGVYIKAGNYKAEGNIPADVHDKTSSKIDFTIQ